MDALVLSAGGMFGAWQAGAWQALESAFEPDLVVGASVGSLNGWMIASRCPTSEIVAHWRTPRSLGPAMQSPASPDLPLPGFMNAEPILNLARALAERYRPVTPLSVVCTEFPALRARVFSGAAVTEHHLYASCAVPFILPACRLPDGRIYGDGGYLGPLPLWAAARAGATRILAIHVLPPMPWWLDLKMRTVRFLAGHDDRVPTEVDVISVGPKKMLGSARDSAVHDPANTERWLAEGRQAGEAAVGRLRR